MATPNSEEEESLLCLETFISPTPPSDDSDLTSPASSIVWINNHGQVTSLTKNIQTGTNGNRIQGIPVKVALHGINENNFLKNRNGIQQNLKEISNAQLLKQTLIEGITVTGEKYKVLVQKDINSNFQSKCASDSQKLVGNDGGTHQRMSGSNGFDRNRVTGSSSAGVNESLSRLSDGSSTHTQGQSGPLVATGEGMLMGRVGGVGAVAFHEQGARSIMTGSAGAGTHSNISGVFRPPQSLSDSGRYGAAYSTTASTVGPYSPLYTVSPYSAFYGQGYPAYSIDRAGLGSYSAVLQSMGTQAQSHVPRSSYGSAAAGSLSQYPLMTVNQGSPAGSSKGYSVSPGREREELSYRREQELELHRRHSTTGIVKDESGRHFSVPSAYTEPARASVSSVLRESPNNKRGEISSGGQDFYKDPSGREGSLKYRLLRPSDSSSIRDPQHSAFSNTDEPLPKRTKLETNESDRKDTVDTKDSGLGMSGRSCTLGAPGNSGSGNGAELHYPQHFMKGSIIQLANGDIKRVEELETSDFVHSADISNDLKIDSSTVVHIEENLTQGTAVLGFVVGEHKVQVSTEATLEHPFFVFGQGWSSCQPTWTMQRYGLECHKLSVGDVCISLTHKEVSQHAAEISEQQKQQKQMDGNSIFHKSLLKRETDVNVNVKQSVASPLSLSQRGVTSSQSHSQSVGSYTNPGISYSRSGLGHVSVGDASGPVKDDHPASFSSSNQIPTTTKPQDPLNPKSSSS